jgi:hypothetical protein
VAISGPVRSILTTPPILSTGRQATEAGDELYVSRHLLPASIRLTRRVGTDADSPLVNGLRFAMPRRGCARYPRRGREPLSPPASSGRVLPPDLVYRGVLVPASGSALLPARCKLGRHTLAHSQFRAVVQDGETQISCLACATDGTDHSWRLSTRAPAPERAELSEELYFDLVLRRQPSTLASRDDHCA